MRAISKILIPALLLAIGSMALAQPGAEHRIGAGDVVAIQVFGEPDLSPQIKVSEKGTVHYPFLGELDVDGLTTRQLEATITDGLKGPYLVDPRVSVTIADYRPFYVNGEVKSPGGFAWEPGMTVRKAVSLAGGLSPRASARKIYLLPEGSDQGERIRVELDSPIGPGDIITVEESFF